MKVLTSTEIKNVTGGGFWDSFTSFVNCVTYNAATGYSVPGAIAACLR